MPTNVELTAMVLDLQNRVANLEEIVEDIQNMPIDPVYAVIDSNLNWVLDGNGNYFVSVVPAIKALRQFFSLGINEAKSVVDRRKPYWIAQHPEPKE